MPENGVLCGRAAVLTPGASRFDWPTSGAVIRFVTASKRSAACGTPGNANWVDAIRRERSEVGLDGCAAAVNWVVLGRWMLTDDCGSETIGDSTSTVATDVNG